MKKINEVLKKNYNVLLRNKFSLATMIFGPILIIFILGFLFNNQNSYNINVGLYAPQETDLYNSYYNNLKQDGHSLEKFPWVIQYNKRDLPGVDAVETLEKKLNFFNVPSFEGIAVKGDGVFNTLKSVINGVVEHVQSHLT